MNLNVFRLLISSFFLITATVVYCAGVNSIQNLISPPETETDKTITLLWEKPEHSDKINRYDIYVNKQCVGSSKITNYTINGLKSNQTYLVTVVTNNADGKFSSHSNVLKVKTKESGAVFNILDYGAIPKDGNLNTQAIQKAIDACSYGGIVYIPEGIFESGALFLKSNMTLYIAKGGVLKGSNNSIDYSPLIKTRFEGWEVQTYASLITAGQLDATGKYNVRNISIRGYGKISGGGQPLGNAMSEVHGERGRGRLICIMNAENVNIQGLTIEESPCWTIHYTYSKNVTCNGLNIFSSVRNGDGIDPDSSINSYIFNCSFSTGDDCIAIKSGKNPEGNVVNRPCENVFISNCNFQKGHSVAIGSEISGGIKNVIISDCEIGNLWFGLQVKTTTARGGYIVGLKVRDCNLNLIKIITSVPYNNDGASAKSITVLKKFEFFNLNMKNADVKKPVIFIEGFKQTENYIKNVSFKNIQLPNMSKISVENVENIKFENVKLTDGKQPEYILSHVNNIKRN